MYISTPLSFLFVTISLARDIFIRVGDFDSLRFTPDSVKAAVGDKLQFEFYPRNHSVAQSSFDQPCQATDGGIFSGFFPVPAREIDRFEVTVNTTDPLWLYCSQGRHCQNGMVMVVNPPRTGNSLPAYLAAAARVTAATSPREIAGGVVVPLISLNATSSPTSSPTPATSGASTASASASSSPTLSGSSIGAAITSTSTTGAAGKALLQWSLLGSAGVFAFALT